MRRFSQHLRESADYTHVGHKEAISAAIKGAPCSPCVWLRSSHNCNVHLNVVVK